MNHFLLFVWLATSTAFAAPWVTLTVPTTDGLAVTAEKKGRAMMKLRIDSPSDPSAGMKCSVIYGQMRLPLALQFKTAGVRASTNQQVGNILSYSANLTALMSDRNTNIIPQICAMGLDALPGQVILTLGGTYKMNGRTVVIAPEDAVKLGDFLAAQ